MSLVSDYLDLSETMGAVSECDGVIAATSVVDSIGHDFATVDWTCDEAVIVTGRELVLASSNVSYSYVVLRVCLDDMKSGGGYDGHIVGECVHADCSFHDPVLAVTWVSCVCMFVCVLGGIGCASDAVAN